MPLSNLMWKGSEGDNCELDTATMNAEEMWKQQMHKSCPSQCRLQQRPLHNILTLCSNKLYAVLLACWDVDAAHRPIAMFSALCDAFKEMHTQFEKRGCKRSKCATNDKLKRGEAEI
jgi:hypothetical protein